MKTKPSMEKRLIGNGELAMEREYSVKATDTSYKF